MWAQIRGGVCSWVSYRNVSTVKTKFRNLTRDVKEKFFYEKKERNKTGGRPAPKPINMAKEDIINAMKDTPIFKGIDGEKETFVDWYFRNSNFILYSFLCYP